MAGIALFLPQEIITNILKFLPVKSLIRFQCVCKHWKNLIKTPSFIAAHLDHSVQHRPSLLFHGHLIPKHLQLYLLDCEEQIVEVQNIPVVGGCFWMVGSSNGLLCLRMEEEYGNPNSPPPSYLLWNPAFREVRHVPMTFPHSEGDSFIGFGFSPIVNDYKIVKLYGSMYDCQILRVEVYSLGTGSWKQIEFGNLGGITLTSHAGFTMNGAIFWVGFKQDVGEGREYVVVSFDIAMEEFSLIPVPAIGLDLTYGVDVTEFERRLAILCSPLIGNYESCFIELWVLEEVTGGSGERWSWSKKYTSRPYRCLLCPVTIWRNEIACISHLLPGYEGPEPVEKTVMSNFTSAELKVLFDPRHFIFNYVESLVTVSNIHV